VELCFCLTIYPLSSVLREWVKQNREMAKIVEATQCATVGTKVISVRLKHVLREIHSFFHFVVHLKTGPRRVLHRVRSTSSSNCLRLLLRLLIRLSFAFIPPPLSPFNNVFCKTVPTLDVTNPASIPSFHCMYDIPLHLD